MIENGELLGGYFVSIEPSKGGKYQVAYVPKGMSHARGAGGKTGHIPKYRAVVSAQNSVQVEWRNPPIAKDEQTKLANDALHRVSIVHAWLERLDRLFATVRAWAAEFGWATKVVEKPMEGSAIGDYMAPALLVLDEGDMRVILEPTSQAPTDAEGIVELCLMPSYEDIATLYFDGKRWRVYDRRSDESGAGLANGEPKVLSKSTFRNLVGELMSHAA
jgi:hypothetical protein